MAASWIPVNKTTGIQYPPVDDAGRAHYEADPITKGKYRFVSADGLTVKVPKPQPTAAKKQHEKTITPVGVEIPKEETPEADNEQE